MNVKLTFRDQDDTIIEWRYVQDDGDNVEFEMRQMIARRSEGGVLEPFNVQIEAI